VHERSPGERWRAGLRALYGKIRRTAGVDAGLAEHSLDWMPAAHYRRYWPSMPAFAVPAFYDGRVRVNLEGREGQGIVASADYGRVVEEVTALVTACRDAHTGAPVVADVTRCDGDPYALNGSGSDIEILFQGCSTGWQHPEFGVIGPLPFRRTGGHTGDHGIAWFAGNGLAGQDLGTRSAFDVVPTLFALMGQAVPAGLSGTPIELDRQ
jgi:predicted AlkP superfamily phosphohydrolase/phosphomutase